MTDKRRRLFLSMLIACGALIVLVGVLSGFLYRSANVVETFVPASPVEVKRVSVEEAKAAFDNGKATFVDLRDSGSFERAHIPGALFIPIDQLADRIDELDRSSWIITYCS